MCCVAARQTPCQVLVCPLFCPSNFFFRSHSPYTRTPNSPLELFFLSLCVCVCLTTNVRAFFLYIHAAKGRMRATLSNNVPFHAAYIFVNTLCNLYRITNDSTTITLINYSPNKFLRMMYTWTDDTRVHRTCM